ncbi:MAG TPA: outer membrane beta-barrel protein [Candidatus Eisenbacteria bacterium]|nr:outer membrane beta-barrel protein [Candidatus Eisenbacteria bacterium]
MNKPTITRTSLFVLAVLAALAASLPASAGSYYRKGTFEAAGGVNFPVGETADYLTSSGTLLFGGGRNLNESTALQVEWTHNWLEFDQAVLERAESDSVHFDDTHASTWSMTLNLVKRINPKSEIVPWLTGGMGYYKRNIQITQEMLLYYPPFWDPWWGWVDGGWAPGEVITGNREASGFGFNVGFGFDTQIDSGASLFLDVRYHHAYLDGVDVTLIPIMAGVRW